MDPSSSGGPQNSPSPPPTRPNNPTLWLALILASVLVFLYFTQGTIKRSEITYGYFREQLAADNVAEVEVRGSRLVGQFKKPPQVDGKDGQKTDLLKDFVAILPPYPLVDKSLDEELRKKLGKDYSAMEQTDGAGMMMLLTLGLTIALFVGLWLMMRRTRDQVLGGGLLSGFIKSPARRYESGEQPITFDDVAGLEGVKADLEEVVQFLKNPKKFQRLGGRVPKGVLLMGPPGTGKTLLARAVAGEAGVPFYSISGSEFIQMFVGVGAGRVRDLFATAKANSPSILFIDEIDAVGRHRGAGLGGGHDEREQTLNQILSEMDGFTQTESVIVMAATNRPDILDPALLRPGRFDRHIVVDRPSYKGRLAILKVHSRRVVLSDEVDLERLAAGTVGLTGADLRNLVNEAALGATREGKERIEMIDFEHARDKILMGSKREEVLTGKEKRMTAYHESGHALLAWLESSLDRVHKVSIIPRGRALGVTQILPEEDRVNISESELRSRLLFGLGGRAAERLVFNELSAGSESDLKHATQIARRMVTHWGMSDRLGPVAFRTSEEHPFLGREIAEPREFSEHTAQIIDEEVVRILREADERARTILEEHRDKLDVLSQALEREETLDERQIEELIGPPVHRHHDRDSAGEKDAADKKESTDKTESAAKTDSPNEPTSAEKPPA